MLHPKEVPNFSPCKALEPCLLQVGANRSQLDSTKWWEGAFDTALTVINHEVNCCDWSAACFCSCTVNFPLNLAAKLLLQESDSDSDSDVSTADEVTVQVRNSDGTVTSAAQHELQIAADLAAQPAWFGGGRFGGREGKLARIRQQEALAAAKL